MNSNVNDKRESLRDGGEISLLRTNGYSSSSGRRRVSYRVREQNERFREIFTGFPDIYRWSERVRETSGDPGSTEREEV